MRKIKVFDAILAALFVVMLGLNFVQVIFRYLLHRPLFWSEEASIFLMVSIVFLCVGVLTRDREHIVIDVLDSLPPGRTLRVIDLVQHIITGLIAGTFVYLCAHYLLQVYGRGTVSTALRLPMWVPVSSMVIGSAFSVFYSVRSAVRDARLLASETADKEGYVP